jgi:hypothetical protein
MSKLIANSGAGTTYPSEPPEFIPGFRGVLVVQSLVFLGVFDIYCLSFCLFSFILSVLLLLRRDGPF